jgi:hypothetical protein
MKVNERFLTASEGKMLTNGTVYASSVRLGDWDSADNWHEVSKEEYERQFGKFTMEYDKIEETQIIIVQWSDVGFDYEQSDGSDIDFYAEKLAEALLGSGQEFIEYQK